MKDTQKVIFAEAKEDEPVQVLHAACEGCPSGQDSGLYQHIFALLLAGEQYGPPHGERSLPGEDPVTSLGQSWVFVRETLS